MFANELGRNRTPLSAIGLDEDRAHLLMFANEFGRNRLPLSFFVAAVIAFFYRLQKHSSIFRFFAKLVNKAMARRALKWVVMQTRGLIWALVCKLLPFTPLYDLCL